MVKTSKKLTRLTTAVMLAGLSFSVTGVNAVEVTGDITITSDYAFRGISQTDEAPALQGGLSLSSESGFYVSVWGSSVDFGGRGTLELDVLAGWAGALNEDWSADVGIMRYGYPNTEFEGSNFWELYGSLSYHDLTFGLAYSDDYYGNSGKFFYYYGSYSYALTDYLSLGVHIGYNDADNSDDSYTDWGVSLSTEVIGLGLSLAYVDTDVDDCNLCDSRFIFSVSKSF